MKVSIDPKYCVGHGMCHLNAPDVFGLDDDGHGVALEGEIPSALRESARLGSESCPQQAISIEE
ncbi:unannotated protein [freshwater metagenome]|uniref:Unannotated protein n=1 Tax=freshwater metagenome TaxID=449393 RepID=A0A6J7S782_9ZZZZ|nr:ferredoxin [Actinomycetota bacterium]MSW36366.1 ferredoxin [Actinomycetota bacterium]